MPRPSTEPTLVTAQILRAWPLPDPAGGKNARGSILYKILSDRTLREITILNMSDWHAQLTPLAETADTVTSAGAANPTFTIGGAAFLDTWFDSYAADAAGRAIRVTGGDSFGGATPPISNFFDDKPAVEIMNMMGWNAEAVGNHSFDRGEQCAKEEVRDEQANDDGRTSEEQVLREQLRHHAASSGPERRPDCHLLLTPQRPHRLQGHHVRTPDE